MTVKEFAKALVAEIYGMRLPYCSTPEESAIDDAMSNIAVAIERVIDKNGHRIMTDHFRALAEAATQDKLRDGEDLRVTVYNGKYTVIQNSTGGLRALRHGEEWQDLTGNGMVLALAQEIEDLRATILEWHDRPTPKSLAEGAK